jgi:hypothetical protein
MKDSDIRQAPMVAMKNRERIASSKRCGCYHCLEIFPKEEIKEWTDASETAICPHCHVDAIISDSTGILLDKATLRAMHDFWMSPKEGKNDNAQQRTQNPLR